jgi:hemolysin III
MPCSIPACRPFTQPYDRAEVAADAVIHAIGLALAIPGIVSLISAANGLPDFQRMSAWVYGIGLLTVLCTSTAYNMWPIGATKLLLRRFDQCAVYFFIAATYTPFVAQSQPVAFSKGLLIAIWAVAWFGAALKLMLPGRLERLSILLCLILAWSGLLSYDAIFSPLPLATISLILVGGALYSTGVLFHQWDRLRFQNAIWHAFVVGAASSQFFAVFNSVSASAGASG